MNELLPLRSSSQDEWELAVLRSARADAPPEGASKRVALALGVSAAVVTTSSAAASSATASALGAVKSIGTAGAWGAAKSIGTAAVVSASSGSVAAGIAGSSLATWAGIGIAAGIAASVAGHTLTRSLPSGTAAAPHASVVVAAPAKGVRSSVGPRGSEETLTPFPELPTASSPSLVAAPAQKRSTRAFALDAPSMPATPAPLEASSLAQEVGALDEVRHALEAGRGRAALDALSRYRMRFPAGALGTEAAVLRVKALLMVGDRAAAEREADVILQGAPASRYAERVRALLGRGQR